MTREPGRVALALAPLIALGGGCTPKIPDPPPPAEIEPAPPPSSAATTDDSTTAETLQPTDTAARTPETGKPGSTSAAIEVHESGILASEMLELADRAPDEPRLELLLLASGTASGGDDDDLSDPEGHDQWRGATLAARLEGEAKAHNWLPLRLDAFADSYSLHLARVRERPTLLDVRVNTHTGEDNWFTGVDAYLLRSHGVDRVPEIVWEGREAYEGVLDICTTMDAVRYRAKPDTVELVRTAQQIYSPSEPGDRERVPRDDCPPQGETVTAKETVWTLSEGPGSARPPSDARGR